MSACVFSERWKRKRREVGRTCRGYESNVIIPPEGKLSSVAVVETQADHKGSDGGKDPVERVDFWFYVRVRLSLGHYDGCVGDCGGHRGASLNERCGRGWTVAWRTERDHLDRCCRSSCLLYTSTSLYNVVGQYAHLCSYTTRQGTIGSLLSSPRGTKQMATAIISRVCFRRRGSKV